MSVSHSARQCSSSSRPPALRKTPQFGQPIAPADIAPWDISIGPDGTGLPPGRGTATQGEAVYAAKCQACHGEKGAGRPNDQLVGGIGSLAPDKAPVKTVGSYWPYATTLFDYVRRAMPFQETKSLTNDELYAVSAYILNLNGIIGRERRARCAVAAQGENAEPGWFHPVPAQSAVSGRGHAICGFAVGQHRAFFCSVSGHRREPTRSGRLQSEQRSELPHRRLHALAGRQGRIRRQIVLLRTTTEVSPTKPRATTTARLSTTTKRSGSIRSSRPPTSTGARYIRPRATTTSPATTTARETVSNPNSSTGSRQIPHYSERRPSGMIVSANFAPAVYASIRTALFKFAPSRLARL